MFKDRETRKAKSIANQEKEKQLKKSMVEKIQQIQKTQNQTKGRSTSMEGWNTTWPSMPNIIPMEAQKYQKVVNSHEKLIIVEEIFLYIGKQMLKPSYILNLGQLPKIALELKRYI